MNAAHGKLLHEEPKTLAEVVNNLLWIDGSTLKFTQNLEDVVFGFADWYCNSLTNENRKSPKEEFANYLEIHRQIG
jgi:hypothetical protein